MRVSPKLRQVAVIVLFSASLGASAASARGPSPDTPDGMWMDLSNTDLAAFPAKSAPRDTIVQPTEYRPAWLDEARLDDLLRTTPLEILGEPDDSAKSEDTLWLPMPD